MKSSLLKLFYVLALFCTTAACADVVVIVNRANLDEISREDIYRLFLGKTKHFPGGGSAVVINLHGADQVRQHFDKLVFNKRPSQIRAYWSRREFSGRGKAPKEFSSSVEVMTLVASNPNLIGYIDSSVLDQSVRVVDVLSGIKKPES